MVIARLLRFDKRSQNFTTPKNKKAAFPFRKRPGGKFLVALIFLLAYLAAHKLRRSASPAINNEGAARKVEAKVMLLSAKHGLFHF
jgi:hypothetical protein